MEVLIIICAFSFGILFGWGFAIYRIAKDTRVLSLTEKEEAEGISIQKLQPDEAVCKKPPEGHLLMAVTPEVARRLVNTKNLTQGDMRTLMWNQ